MSASVYRTKKSLDSFEVFRLSPASYCHVCSINFVFSKHFGHPSRSLFLQVVLGRLDALLAVSLVMMIAVMDIMVVTVVVTTMAIVIIMIKI